MDVAHQLVVPGQRCRNVAVAASGKGGNVSEAAIGNSHVPGEMPPIYVPPREDSRRPASPAADDGSRSSSRSARTVDGPTEATPTRPAAAAVGSRNDATRGSEEEHELQAAARGAKGQGEPNASRPGQSPAPVAGTTSSNSGSAPAGLEEPRPSVEAGRAGSGQATFCDRLLSCFGLCCDRLLSCFGLCS
ncbi:hypothetical protein PVAP13_5KG367100 [Panicum virgatum]|uniref:Uncharacterized protein n=1 Tax=Panicum virgatum TaxID=38727 RepID=A0A8T0SN61_PANVG|nr:hypothetical protein PVAP13_5KG367100 [Panicum virgatum]